MLYDKRWDAKIETKADPFTLEALIAWLEKQPAKQTYRYICNGHCLLAQYFTAHGFKDVSIDPESLWVGKEEYRRLPPYFDAIAIDCTTYFPRKTPADFTFGGALARARQAQRFIGCGND